VRCNYEFLEKFGTEQKALQGKCGVVANSLIYEKKL
jgi:hypothetical protein